MPRSDGWNRTPNRRIQAGQLADARIDEARERFVGLAAGHAQQVGDVLVFGVGLGQQLGRRVVHAPQVAGVAAVAAAEARAARSRGR